MKNNHFYSTKEVLKKVGITRPTLYKWLKEGKVHEVARDRNNFRLFTKEDVDEILSYKNLIRQPFSNGGNEVGGKVYVKK